MSVKNNRRWMAIFDNHGDMQDKKAVAVALEFMKLWKPEIRVHGGDCFDFRPLRRKASEEEKRDAIDLDIAMGCDLLRRFQPTHFLRGNHDERLWDWAKSDEGTIATLAKNVIGQIETALGDADMYPYDKRKGVCNIGKLRFLHGYSAGVSATRTTGLVYGSCLFGHVHYVDSYTIPRYSNSGRSVEMARACGCLCRLDQDYNRAQIQTLRQEHGFAYGIIRPDGTYHAFQAHPVVGRWCLPTELYDPSERAI